MLPLFFPALFQTLARVLRQVQQITQLALWGQLRLSRVAFINGRFLQLVGIALEQTVHKEESEVIFPTPEVKVLRSSRNGISPLVKRYA
jgi:hypothetical protein